VVVTGLFSATESGPDTFSALGVTASVSGSLNATEQGSDTAEIRTSEQVAGGGAGFVMVDRPSTLWWKRKPKALSEEAADQKVKRVVRVIEQIARQQPEQKAKQTQREVARAVAPMLAEMPGFDWTPVFRQVIQEMQRQQQEEAARIEAVIQIERIRAIEQDDEDVLFLLMSL
jgi:RNA processing factor Prp31